MIVGYTAYPANSTITVNNFQVAKGTAEIEYADPREEAIANIAPIVEKYFPDGMRSAGSVHDEIDLERGVAVQRVGYVKLNGSESWTIADSGETTVRYQLRVTEWGAKSGGDGMCSRNHWVKVGVSNDKLCCGVNANVLYYRVPASIDTIEKFEEHLADGVEIAYELAEPIETPITEELPTDIVIEAGGSLTFVNDQGDHYRVPIPNQQTRLIKLGGAN